MRRTLKFSLVIFVTLGLLIYTVSVADLGEILSVFRQFPFLTLLLVFVLGFVSLAVAAFRLCRIIGHFGVVIGFWASARATLAGLLASFYIVQLAGTILGRHHVLRGAGIGPALISLITYYERAILALIGGGFCILGGVIVFGREYTTGVFEQVGLGEIAILAGTAFWLSVLVFGTRFERSVIVAVMTGRTVLRVIEILGISLVGQGLNILIFYIALRSLGVDADTIMLLGAAAIVGFAASLPISLNGWGVREFAALHVFGILGVPPAESVAIAAMVGLSSALVVVLGTALFIKQVPKLRNVTVKDNTTHQPLGLLLSSPGVLSRMIPDNVNSDRLLAILLALSVGILLFFQTHVDLPGALISVNLADPLALIALTTLILVILTRGIERLWSRPWFPVLLFLFWGWLIVGFAIGWVEYGLVPWALTNRVIGWGVILGYVAVGAFLTMTMGIRGFRRLTETMAIVAVLIISVELCFRYLFSLGLDVRVPENFDGYSANRNAFGFMLLILVSCLIPLSSVYHRVKSTWIWSVILGMLLFGGWLTAGRTVLLVGLLVIFAAFVLGYGSRKFIIHGLIWAVIFCGITVILTAVAPDISAWLDTVSTGPRFHGPSFVTQSGDSERWLSLWRGMELWFEAPVFGAGLGAFAQMKLGEFGQALLIHSTFVWLLAELGLIGFILFCGMLAYGAWPEIRRFYCLRVPRHQALLLVLLVFGTFGLVHDIAYQRIFWLMIGVCLAYPGALTRAHGQDR